ncbi:MAG: tRNA pseudouridine(38-40) synthase TruA [bacterium]|nr:tRNA pseudouridine(38-40) synthase TruA [bacterium]
MSRGGRESRGDHGGGRDPLRAGELRDLVASEPPPPGRRTIRVELEFDGGGFEGWQRQVAARTVQGEVEDALERLLQAPHAVLGCSRTDSGVHAKGLVASFRTLSSLPTNKLFQGLDALLPEDVGVISLRDVASAFHARRHALWKWYRFRILVSRRKRPLVRNVCWRVPHVPPLMGLTAAADAIVGQHDFRSFANTGGSPGRSTVRTLHHVRWRVQGDERQLDVVGGGFLYKMVRTMVGTMLEAGATPDPAAAMQAVLQSRDRRAAGKAVPAHGLCLMAVAMLGEPVPERVPAGLLPVVDSRSEIHCSGSKTQRDSRTQSGGVV